MLLASYLLGECIEFVQNNNTETRLPSFSLFPPLCYKNITSTKPFDLILMIHSGGRSKLKCIKGDTIVGRTQVSAAANDFSAQ